MGETENESDECNLATWSVLIRSSGAIWGNFGGIWSRFEVWEVFFWARTIDLRSKGWRGITEGGEWRKEEVPFQQRKQRGQIPVQGSNTLSTEGRPEWPNRWGPQGAGFTTGLCIPVRIWDSILGAMENQRRLLDEGLHFSVLSLVAAVRIH